MTDTKTIILCADDFGFNSGISTGILKLAGMQRLSAVSCMTNMPDFNLRGKDLCVLKDKVQTGLHFNLTEGYSLSAPNQPCFHLSRILIKTHLMMINPSLIAKEFNAQLDQYISIMGGLPDFIDGHQHVHQFPGIRQVILKIYEERLKTNGTYIRSTVPLLNLSPYLFKGRILAATGGRALSSRLKALNIPHNPYFAGVYDFAPDSNYRELFRKWLSLVSSNTLIMCHPGEGRVDTDEIAPARNLEMAYFLSDGFLTDCQEYQIKLTTGPKS